MEYIWLIIYLIISIVHLIACYLKKLKFRFMTKPLLIPMLFIYYALSVQQYDAIILCSLSLAWLGDIFLIFDYTFYEGVVAFLLGDLLYAKYFYDHIKTKNAYYLAGLLLFYFSFYTLCMYLPLRKHVGKIKPLVYIFFIPLLLNNLLALYYLIYEISLANVLIFIGTAFYWSSDYFILRTEFKEHFEHESVVTMGTYIIAQGGIVLGLSLKTI